MALNFDSGCRAFDEFGKIVIAASSEANTPVWYDVPFWMQNRNFAIVHCLLEGETIAFGVYKRSTGELKYRRGIIPVKLKIDERSIDQVVNWLDKLTLDQVMEYSVSILIRERT